MKSGEKRAFLSVLVVFLCVIGFTIYMEIRSQQIDRDMRFAGLMNDGMITIAPGAGIAVIPTGLNPDALPDAAQRGATILTLYCTQCHDLPTPLMHSAPEWTSILDRMEQRMRARRGEMLTKIMMPPEKDWKILRDYMATHAQQALENQQLADLDSPAGKSFTNTCSQCHATPDPASHTAHEWPRVVLRMQNNMRMAGKEPPDSQTADLVISYLQLHSRPSEK